jgi:Zn-dependent peptidase ImmA (M78 family)
MVLPQSSRVWHSELANNLRDSQNAATVEEAALLLVQQCLKIISERKYPVDLSLIASILGIDPKFQKGDLPDDKFACIVPQNGRDTIILNKKYPARWRFSSAHEIAHRMLKGKSLRSTRWRSQQEEDLEHGEEERLCDLIAAYILGLTPDILEPLLMDRPISIEVVDEIQQTFDISMETAIRACIDYCEFPCAAFQLYPESTKLFVARMYSKPSFPRLWGWGAEFPVMTCLKRVGESNIARTQERHMADNVSYAFYAHARRQTVYQKNRPYQGYLVILELVS